MIAENTLMIVPFVGDNATSLFPFPFRIWENADVEVKVRLDADGTETVLVLTTDYTIPVAGLIDPTGDVQLVDVGQAWIQTGGLKSGYTMYIYFKANEKQLAQFRDLGAHAPISFERSLDKITSFLKSYFSDQGDISRSMKMPTKLHQSDFDPTLPDDINDLADNVIAINATMDGFVKRVLPDATTLTLLEEFITTAYVPYAIQTVGVGQEITIVKLYRQHRRIKSGGGALAMNVQPFGNNPALFYDGMEIVVEPQETANYLTLAENDSQYGYIGNGALRFRKGDMVTFVYSGVLERFLVKSNYLAD